MPLIHQHTRHSMVQLYNYCAEYTSASADILNMVYLCRFCNQDTWRALVSHGRSSMTSISSWCEWKIYPFSPFKGSYQVQARSHSPQIREKLIVSKANGGRGEGTPMIGLCCTRFGVTFFTTPSRIRCGGVQEAGTALHHDDGDKKLYCTSGAMPSMISGLFPSCTHNTNRRWIPLAMRPSKMLIFEES